MSDRRSALRRRLGAALLVAAAGACTGGGDGGSPASSPSTSTTSPPSSTSTVPGPVESSVLAFGDIASCELEDDEAVAAYVATTDEPILALGDIVYQRGTAETFQRCFLPTWSPMRHRFVPVPGNHEYLDDGAAGYFEVFGTAAGTAGEGWHARDIGSWRVIGLNSNCAAVGGCGPDSPQGRWLQSELADNARPCSIAFWHHPRFSAGRVHGDQSQVDGLWRAVHAAGVDVVLAGHEHIYERWTELAADGTPAAPGTGTRQFVVGTGGASRYGARPGRTGLEVARDDMVGVLRLHLGDGAYRWEYVGVEGVAVDTGEGRCR